MRFIESFFTDNMVLVVLFKMLSTEDCSVFLVNRPITMANKLSRQMNQRQNCALELGIQNRNCFL